MMLALAVVPALLLAPDARPVASEADSLRIGVGYWGGAGSIDHTAGVGVLGLSAQLGVQVNDHLAFYVLAEGSYAIWSMLGGAFAMAEWTFAGRFAVATGVGAAGARVASFPGAEALFALGAPLRLSLTLGNFFVALDGFAGYAPSGGAFSYFGGLGLGFQS